jgi:hypothetical protein
MLTTAIIFTVLVAVWGRSGATAARTRPRRKRVRDHGASDDFVLDATVFSTGSAAPRDRCAAPRDR